MTTRVSKREDPMGVWPTVARAMDSHAEPTYENQLWHARKLLAEKGRGALDNPHGMTGRTCGCGSCFCCAAAEVVRMYDKRPKGTFPGEQRRTRFEATGEFRSPLKGEFYLSGAIVFAYRAPNDLGTPYWIAKAVQS